MPNRTISTKVPSDLQKQVNEIAAIEQRTASNVVRLAIESYVKDYFEVHPQFRADILEAKEVIRSGEVEDYEFG
jgi:predicted transcriptional regulator